MTDAARRYKRIIGELTTVADTLRAHDKEQEVVLRRRLVDLDLGMVRAEERAALTRLAAELRWEAVLEALWKEEWLTLRPHPRPDPDAERPAPDVEVDQLDALDVEVDRTATALLDAARRRFWQL